MYTFLIMLLYSLVQSSEVSKNHTSEVSENHTITFQQHLNYQDTNNPIIVIQIQPPISYMQFQYVIQNYKISSGETSISYMTYYRGDSNSINTIYIDVITSIPLSIATVQIQFNDQSTLAKYGTKIFEFEPLVMISQMTNYSGEQQITYLRRAAQIFDNQIIKFIGYLGIFSIVTNSPQELIQLQFLNFTAPLNVYQFERSLSYWVLDTHIPDWEDQQQNNCSKLLQSVKYFMDYSTVRWMMYHFYLNDILGYVQMIGLICGIAILITLGFSFIRRKRITDEKLVFLQQLPLNSYSTSQSILDQPDQIFKLQQFKDLLLGLIMKESKFEQYARFLVLNVFLEGKLCIFINSLLISLYQPDTSSHQGIISFICSIMLFLLYTSYYSLTIYKMNKDYNKRKLITQIISKDPNPDYEELIIQFDLYLYSEYRYFLENKKLSQKVLFFSTFIFLSKKWIYAIILVYLYDQIIIQIYLLIVVHLFYLLFKVLFFPYKLKTQNILTGFGDIIFIIVLVMKYNDFNNFIIIDNNATVAQLQKWVNDGFITIAFEIVFLACYLLWFLIKAVSKLVALIKNRRQVTYKSIDNEPRQVSISLQEVKQQEVTNNFQFHQLEESSSYFFDPIQQVQNENTMTDKWLKYNYQPYVTPLSQKNDLNEHGLNQQQNQSALVRQGVIPLKNNMNLQYYFERNNQTEIGQKVFENSKFVEGSFYFSVYGDNKDQFYSLNQILVGFVQPQSPKVTYSSIKYDQLTKFYVHKINFGNQNHELLLRQIKIQVESKIHDQSFIDIVTLSGSDLLLFEPIQDQNNENYADYQLSQSTFIKLSTEANLKLFLIRNFAWINQTKNHETYVVRMNFPLISSLYAQYLDILILLEKKSKDSKLSLRLLVKSNHLIQILEFSSEQEILQHYFTDLVNYLQDE